MKIQNLSRARRMLAGLLLAGGLLANPAIAGSWQQNVSVGGFNKVHLYTPDSVSAIGQGRGLLVVLHGCTQSIDAYLSANLTQKAKGARKNLGHWAKRKPIIVLIKSGVSTRLFSTSATSSSL